MSGGFNVKYKDLYKLSQEYKDELDDFKDAVDECSKTVADMINNDSFTGATADSVKSYLSDVHITLLASMKALAQNMQDQVALYKAGYYGIDNKTDFILGEEAINSYKTCLDTQLSRLAEREEIVNGAIDSIADLLPFKKPSTEGIYTSHQALNTEMDTLKENVSNQESMTVEALEGSTKVLLTYVKNSVNLLKGKSYQMANYTPNSFFQNKNAYAMAYLSEAFYQQHEENEDVYDSIWEAEEEKAEAARERATQGVWKTIGGVALVVTGAVCIVATAGAATPAVAAVGAVAGGGTIVFGAADAAEGGQEIYYGNTGNIDSTSFNAIRDTIFQGNREAYQFTESIFAFTASAMVPIGAAAKAHTLTFRSGSVAVGKLAISNVAGQGASKITMDLTDNRVLSMIAGMGASTLTGYGLNAIDNKFSISAGPTKTTAELLKESSCTKDELYKYLRKQKGDIIANKYLKEGIWPDDVQIPKESSFIKADGGQDWSKAPHDGYTLDADGNPIKEPISPKSKEVFDRYGSSNGRYTSPVGEKGPYSYDSRSLPYVEDPRQYHRYMLTDDFSKLEEYVNNCPDPDVKSAIQMTVEDYYGGDYSKLCNSGTAAGVPGWGNGGATQWEFGIKIEMLEKIGIVKEINVPNSIDTTFYNNPWFFIQDEENGE